MKVMNCKFCDKLLKKGSSHQTYCKQNPDRKDLSGKNNPMFGKKGANQYSDGILKMSDETRKKITDKQTGRSLSESHKKSVSDSMKIAHFEKRAWNLGKSRWNSKESYPEKFFKRVIENEFIDKNYISEYPVGIYSLDFAWPEKKKVIEIDGEQHQRFEEYRLRDQRKDVFLTEKGWEILRISWKEMCNSTKEKIKEAYNFIHLER